MVCAGFLLLQLSRNNSSVHHIEDGLSQDQFARLVDTCNLELTWRATVGILFQLGLRQSQLSKLADSRPEIFQMTAKTMRQKLAFLKDTVGLKEEELTKVVVKAPRILEYQCESLNKRLVFLKDTGVLPKDIPKVILKAPMILALSVEDTLRPRRRFLQEELYIPEAKMGKLFARHPQILTCTEDMMRQRSVFLSGECGLGHRELSHAVMAHPQILHYKIDSMRIRIDYLYSIGMSQDQIAASIGRFPQLLSLSVSSNMAPKWHYLVEHLGGNVASLAAYPGYFSLSLVNRIIPRHCYLQKLRGGEAPMPFPMSALKMSDKKFATEIARSSLVEFEEFKDGILKNKNLADLALGMEQIAGLENGHTRLGSIDQSVDPTNSMKDVSSPEGWVVPLGTPQRLSKSNSGGSSSGYISRSVARGDIGGSLGNNRGNSSLGPVSSGLAIPRKLPAVRRALPDNSTT